MEKIYLKILHKNNVISGEFKSHPNAVNCAKELADLNRKFIEWVSFGNHPFVNWTDEQGDFYTNEISDKRYSVDDLFQYWYKEIYNQ